MCVNERSVARVVRIERQEERREGERFIAGSSARGQSIQSLSLTFFHSLSPRAVNALSLLLFRN